VEALLPEIEAALAPLEARPHWGKLFAAEAAQIAPLYPRFDDFRALALRMDPEGKFRNPFLDRTIFGTTP
jgi:xylitol oxidase